MEKSAVMWLLAAFVGAALVWQAIGEEHNAEEEKILRVGDTAPNVKLVTVDADGNNKPVELKSFRGKKNVLLAFYPKAFTPGCTRQLCGYRDDFEQFKNADTEVFAISVEPQEASNRFKREYQLPFNVVGDANQSIVRAFNVPVRGHDGNHFAKRSVFLIDKQGVLKHIDRDYDIEKGQQELYARLTALKQSEEPCCAP